MAQATVPFFYMLYKEMKDKLSSTLPITEVMAARQQYGHYKNYLKSPTGSVLDTPWPNIGDRKFEDGHEVETVVTRRNLFCDQPSY